MKIVGDLYARATVKLLQIPITVVTALVRERMFLRAKKQSSVRFADVRRIATRANEFIYII